jgi:acetoin utilization deacetylase AcuC-like enzyme
VPQVENQARASRTTTVASGGVTVLFATHSAYLEHLAGPRHPERPERLEAVLSGARRGDVFDALVPLEPVAAARVDLERVHPGWYLDRVEGLSRNGGGRLDPDTYASPGTWRAAELAAGAGLTAIREMQSGHGDVAFCAVRPPGHHATSDQSMGFCLVSNVAVAAASLADQGERVMVFDYDAHHGNGTQAVFFRDPRVLFVSLHQSPLYPYSGAWHETGDAAGVGTTLNIPLPAGATGDVYLSAFDEIVAPVAAHFAPTWVIVSAGFDAHRADPITDMGLAAGDYPALTQRALSLVPAGRRLVMLEGGYDLDALADCTAAVLRSLADLPTIVDATEAATAGGPGAAEVAAVRDHWRRNDLI